MKNSYLDTNIFYAFLSTNSLDLADVSDKQLEILGDTLNADGEVYISILTIVEIMNKMVENKCSLLKCVPSHLVRKKEFTDDYFEIITNINQVIKLINGQKKIKFIDNYKIEGIEFHRVDSFDLIHNEIAKKNNLRISTADKKFKKILST